MQDRHVFRISYSPKYTDSTFEYRRARWTLNNGTRLGVYFRGFQFRIWVQGCMLATCSDIRANDPTVHLSPYELTGGDATTCLWCLCSLALLVLIPLSGFYTCNSLRAVKRRACTHTCPCIFVMFTPLYTYVYTLIYMCPSVYMCV